MIRAPATSPWKSFCARRSNNLRAMWPTLAAQASLCCHGESHAVTHGAPCQEAARRASRSPVQRKRVAEHRPAALGLLVSRLVLDDVPMLDEDPILDPKYVYHDPV